MYQFCVACHPRAHPHGYCATAKTPGVWSTWVQAHLRYANPASYLKENAICYGLAKGKKLLTPQSQVHIMFKCVDYMLS